MAPERRDAAEGLLRLTGAELRDGTRRLLADVDLTLHPGQVIGLVGASGSGKTTLLQALAGARPLSAGRRELSSGPLALFPQDAPAALNPALTIARHLSLLDRRVVGAEAIARLRAVGVGAPGTVLRSYPGQLSGGESQRVVWAMVLLAEPRILLLDEPTSALDEALRRATLELLLRHLRQVRGAAVIASHDPRVLLERCTELVVLDRARIVASGPRAEVVAATHHPLIRALAASARASGVGAP